MREDSVSALIDKISDCGITSLADIATLAWPAFLRRVGNRLSLSECHHLYQLAVHRGEFRVRHAACIRANPQIQHVRFLSVSGNASTPSTGKTEPSSPDNTSLSGEQP